MNTFSLYFPCQSKYISQHFGQNDACIEDTPAVPLNKRKIVSKQGQNTCPVGYVEFYPLLGLKGHSGLDMPVPGGTPVYATIDGFVAEIETDPARGLGVGIISSDRFDLGTHGEHFVKIRTWHLLDFKVTMQQKVKIGDLIGHADNTGYSAGNHVHFEGKVIEYDPARWYYNLEQNNGFMGAFDIEMYCNGLYAIDQQLLPLYQKLLGLYQSLLELLKSRKV